MNRKVKISVRLTFADASLCTNHPSFCKNLVLCLDQNCLQGVRPGFGLRSKKDLSITSLFITKICQIYCMRVKFKPGCISSFVSPKSRLLHTMRCLILHPHAPKQYPGGWKTAAQLLTELLVLNAVPIFQAALLSKLCFHEARTENCTAGKLMLIAFACSCGFPATWYWISLIFMSYQLQVRKTVLLVAFWCTKSRPGLSPRTEQGRGWCFCGRLFGFNFGLIWKAEIERNVCLFQMRVSCISYANISRYLYFKYSHLTSKH